jgi:hypothetical protein
MESFALNFEIRFRQVQGLHISHAESGRLHFSHLLQWSEGVAAVGAVSPAVNERLRLGVPVLSLHPFYFTHTSLVSSAMRPFRDALNANKLGAIAQAVSKA